MIKAWLKKLPVLLLIIAFASFTFPRTTFAAIAYGASTDGDNFGGSSTQVTWTSPSVSGSNTVGLVGIVIRGTSPTVTSVTWNGVSMTIAPSSSITANSRMAVWYYLANPAAGATTIVVNGTNFSRIFTHAVYYTGVDQTTPVLDVSTGSNTATSGITGNFTLTNNNEYIHDAVVTAFDCTGITLSVGTRDSSRCDGNGTSAAFGYQGPLASGAQTMVWSDGTTNHTRSGLGINPSVVSSGYLAKQEIIAYLEE